jgi:SAM-dependent methyltransferase
MGFRSFPKLRTFYSGLGWRRQWRKELERRAIGLTVTLDRDDFFKGTNPIYNPVGSMRFLVDRYQPAFDFLDGRPAGSILEIGCAQGLTTWLMSDVARKVTGLDISEERVRIARHLFPEVTFEVGDVFRYLEEHKPHFDVIIQSDGPVTDPAIVLPYCRVYIDIGRSTWWTFAMKGRHLAYRCTAFGEGMSGVSPLYPKYYLRKRWLHDWNNFLRVHRRLRDIPL